MHEGDLVTEYKKKGGGGMKTFAKDAKHFSVL